MAILRDHVQMTQITQIKLSTTPLLYKDVDVDIDVASVLPLCQLLKFLLNNLRYQIRLHLLSKPHYDFQFRQLGSKITY